MSAESLTDFVTLWFGRAPAASTPEELVGPLLRHNELVADPWRDGSVDVLVCENQGAWLWGRGSDGTYVERDNSRSNPWLPLTEDAEQFWLHHAAVEALLAMPAARCGQGLSELGLNRLNGFSEPLPCGEWRWVGAQHVRFRQASIVTVHRDEAGVVEVMAGASSERELGWIDGLGIEWNIFDSKA